MSECSHCSPPCSFSKSLSHHIEVLPSFITHLNSHFNHFLPLASYFRTAPTLPRVQIRCLIHLPITPSKAGTSGGGLLSWNIELLMPSMEKPLPWFLCFTLHSQMWELLSRWWHGGVVAGGERAWALVLGLSWITATGNVAVENWNTDCKWEVMYAPLRDSLTLPVWNDASITSVLVGRLKVSNSMYDSEYSTLNFMKIEKPL